MTNATAVSEPRCPLCDRLINPPRAAEPRRFADFEFGVCECGAVYVHDVTGHNLGAALVEALGFACNDNWDMAWELLPGEDYQDALIEGYDIESNLIQPTGRTKEGRRVKGVLTFIRLSEDLMELTGDKVTARFNTGDNEEAAKRLEAQTGGEASIKARQDLTAQRYSKQEIQNLVRRGRFEELCSMALSDPLVTRKMQRLLYAADLDMRWKAVMALGAVVGKLAVERPAAAGNIVRALLYACGDSAAANWGAIETLGEIIRLAPDVYGSFIRHLLGLINDPPSRPALFWAIGRIGERHPRLVKSNAFFSIFNFLKDPAPEVRGHAVWALGRIKAAEAVSIIERMTGDEAELNLFDGELLLKTTVGQLAKEAAARIKDVNQGDGMNENKEKDSMLSKAADLYKEGIILLNRGMSLDALLKFERALEIFENEGRDAETANTCEKLADLHVQRGNFKSAIPLYQRAMAICEKGGDDVSKVLLAEKIIDLYRADKEFDKALPYLMLALELVENMRDASRAGYYLTAIGDIYQRQDKIHEALDAYRLAHKIYTGMGSRERIEVLERGISAIEAALGEA
ncbi:MAG: tetratricopeptide repeat protein [Desulfobacteraceae bacterium]|nr:tetratricopeptide repeat protein [Desulfobacteraceae bacterium]